MEVLGQLRPEVLLWVGIRATNKSEPLFYVIFLYGKEVAMLGELSENDAMNT